MPTFCIENFGCRATQADGAELERQFESFGLNRAEIAIADMVVLNTCTVTNSADQDARAAVRRVQRQNPAAKIIVTGCYAQRAPEEIAALPGVSAVIGNSHKHQLAEIVLRPTQIHAAGSGDRQGEFSSKLSSSKLALTSTRSFIPIASLSNPLPLTPDPAFLSPIFSPTPNCLPLRFSNQTARTTATAPAPISKFKMDATTAARSA